MTQKRNPPPPASIARTTSSPTTGSDSVDLDFELGEDGTIVTCRAGVRRNGDHDRPLVLDGEELETLSIRIDGQLWGSDKYSEEAEKLSVHGVPASFTLETQVRIHEQHLAERSVQVQRQLLRSAKRRASAASPGSSIGPT
ncbi:MAG: hypothetical protein R3F17_09165 [Planctomycetota bacterium]